MIYIISRISRLFNLILKTGNSFLDFFWMRLHFYKRDSGNWVTSFFFFLLQLIQILYNGESIFLSFSHSYLKSLSIKACHCVFIQSNPSPEDVSLRTNISANRLSLTHSETVLRISSMTSCLTYLLLFKVRISFLWS